MLDQRPKPSPELIARLNEIGSACVLGGLTLEETIDTLNREARKYGLEYRLPEKRP